MRIALFEVFKVYLFTLGYQGVDNVGLTSFAQLLIYEKVDIVNIVSENMTCSNRLATGGKFVYDRDIKVAI